VTRKGIDEVIMAIDKKEPENSQVFASELALHKYMEREKLVYKMAEVEGIGTVQIRERLVQKDPDSSEEFQENWVVHYSQRVIKKTEFE
jgi:hypothetical protein